VSGNWRLSGILRTASHFVGLERSEGFQTRRRPDPPQVVGPVGQRLAEPLHFERASTQRRFRFHKLPSAPRVKVLPSVSRAWPSPVARRVRFELGRRTGSAGFWAGWSYFLLVLSTHDDFEMGTPKLWSFRLPGLSGALPFRTNPQGSC
jgi:hypothetical protein